MASKHVSSQIHSESRITKEVRSPGSHNFRKVPQVENIELESQSDNNTTDDKKKSNRKKCLKWCKIISAATIVALAIAMGGYFVGFHVQPAYLRSIGVDKSKQTDLLGLMGYVGSESPEYTKSKMQLNLGIRNDYLLQDCKDKNLKKSFPDLDYALLGYHVLKGYPMAIGHDPGFTNPIFKADYTSNRQTGDCKFSIPTGYTVIPDVSCQTSFSSKVVKNSQDLKESMGVSAKISGGGWGVSFGASTDYKKASQTVQSGEKVMVLSTATCQYYFAKMDEVDPPPFTESFLKSVRKLNAINQSDTEILVDKYLDFITYYGTHYMKSVTFGARYMKEHSMSSSSYSSLESESLSVEAMASFSGFGVNVGASLGLSTGKSEAVSKFQQSVETKTITVGSAPPSNGDAMTWASSVKETPVPFRYDMTSIEELFTPEFMSRYQDIDYKKLRQNLDFIKTRYSKHVYRRALEGESKCRVYDAPLEIPDFYLPHAIKNTGKLGQEECSQMCFEKSDCMAVDTHGGYCYSTKETNLTVTYSTGLWTTVYPYKLSVEPVNNYKSEEVAAKFYLRKLKVKVNDNDDAFKITTTTTMASPPVTTANQPKTSTDVKATTKCDITNGGSDKCVKMCIKESNCVMAYQLKHPKQYGLYCCGVVDEFDVQNLDFGSSTDSNEYVVFIKTKC